MYLRWALALFLYAAIMRHFCPQLAVDVLTMRAVQARMAQELAR